jgi:hypothetical protein
MPNQDETDMAKLAAILLLFVSGFIVMKMVFIMFGE